MVVTFADGRTAEGSVAGRDIDGDLAVIAVDTGTAPVLPWADSAAASIGTPVFGLANPGGRGLRVTFGFVSGVERSFRGPRGRRITGSVEHTAALLPGSSGGPVLDAGGQLLGINTHRLGEGFYLAIPADETLRGKAGALARGESAAHPQLGVALAPGHVARRLRRAVGLPEAEGLLIRDLSEGSPAARKPRPGRPDRGGRNRAGPHRRRPVRGARGDPGGLSAQILRGADRRTIQVTFGELTTAARASGPESRSTITGWSQGHQGR